jgi:starvation-inducible DNA-binding protein
MFRTPVTLPETDRASIVEALNATLADGLDLHTRLKHAHWNLKGPLFLPLHELFDAFATAVATHDDDVAERAVVLGGVAAGGLRGAAKVSRLGEDLSATRDVDLARLVLSSVERYLSGVREARATCDARGDADTSDLLTGIVRDVEKRAWFLSASLEG